MRKPRQWVKRPVAKPARRLMGTLSLRFGCPVLATVDPAWANAA